MSSSTAERGRSISWLAGLDGLRALAVAAVVIFHFSPDALPGGFLGVDLFFVISGYLITRLLLAEIDRTGGISVRAFYRRRVRRLLPAVVLLITVTAIGSAVVWHDELATMRGGVLASMFYVTNWWLIGDHQSYFVASGRPPMLQHLWSLAIEEQFYLLWPLVLVGVTGAYVAWRRRDTADRGRMVLPARKLYRVVGVATVLSTASTVAMAVIAIRSDVPYGADSSRVYFGTDTHVMGLLLGAAAGALAVRGMPFARRIIVVRGPFLTDAAAIAALLMLVRIVMSVDEFTPWLYRGGFLAISALCVVLVAATPREGSLVGWALDRAPFRWIGARSYSIYLWHWPVAVVTRPGIDVHIPGWADFLLRVAVTLALADLSYRLVEVPIRTDGVRGLARTWRWDRLPGAAQARTVPVIVVGSVAVAGSVIAVFAYPLPHQPALAVTAHQSGVAPEPHPKLVVSKGSAHAGARPRVVVPTRRSPYPSRPAAAPIKVSAFGDSVMLGAQAEIGASMPGSDVSAVEGRQARDVFDDVDNRLTAGTLDPIVVIHTGNNGIISPDDLSGTLRALSSRKRVIVLTDRVPRDWQGPNNDMLHHVVGRFRNAVLVDWYQLSGGHQAWFYEDGLHLDPAGAAAYAAAIVAAARP